MYRLLASLLACLLFPCLILAADGSETSFLLPEQVVTATAEPAARRELPVFVQVIERREIADSGLATLDDLLTVKTPGTIIKYPGAYTSIRLRGFDSYVSPGANIDAKTLVLVDGNPLGSGNLSLVPLDTVERVEVMSGPGSVLYGASAMGGVINVITRRGTGPVSGAVEAGYGSFDHFSPSASLQGGLGEGAFGFALASRMNTTQAYAMGGDKTYRNTDSHDGAASATLTLRPAEGHDVHLWLNYFDAWDMGDPGPVYQLTPQARVNDSMKNFAATYTGGVSDWDIDWRLACWAGRHDYTNRSTSYYERADLTTHQLGADGRITVPTGSFGRLSVGGRYQSIQELRGGDGVYAPDNRYDAWSLYTEEKVELGDVTVLGGLRYDRYQLAIESNDVIADVDAQGKELSQLSWRLGLNWRALDWLSFRASAGSAFTPPDAYKYSGEYQLWGVTYYGNPNLKPESGVTWEGGVDVAWEGLAISGGYFYTTYDDAITAAPASPDIDPFGQTWVNAKGWQLSGIEASIRRPWEWSVGKRSVSIDPYVNLVCYLDRHLADETLAAQRKTDTVLNLSQYAVTPGIQLGWDNLVRLDLNGQWQGPQTVMDWDPASATYMQTKDKDPFFIFNARLSVHPVENLETYVYVNNVSDERYSYVDGYPMPGRTVGLGLRYTF